MSQVSKTTEPIDDSVLPAHRRASKLSDFTKALKAPGIGAKVSGVADAAKRSRPGRAMAQFSAGQGPLLSAGISYMSLFSLTAALTVGWTAFSSFLGDDSAFRQSVIDAVNTTLPGLLKSSSDPGGLVDPDSLVAVPGTSITGWIALAFAIATASNVVYSLSRAIRTMFGVGSMPDKPIPTFLRRVLGLAVLMVGILCTAVLTSLNTFLHSWVVSQLGQEHSGWAGPLFNLGAIVIPLLVDFFIFIVLVRWVAAIRPPKRDLIGGGIICAIGATVLRLLGTSVVTNVSGPVLAAATTLITLILWVNLLAWITLMASAWTANPPAPLPQKKDIYEHAKESPNYVTLSVPSTLRWLPQTPAQNDEK